MNKEIALKLKGIISNVCGEEKEEIKNLDEHDNLLEVGINSIDFVKLVVLIEEEFDMEFDDDFLDFSKLNKFGDVVAYIEEQIQYK